ncbi:E3 ubiquitin-protein ligase SIRP1-like [Durio zibethinus]|uniref:RING-type E3 ubiquitin transferase n=1 Tax=Durio zibethinus TaxID=66656 RepID=A0A6P5YX79_DURZI|nr:E3 ubiquitin-protein ligase SIRP1-like [Durio zibethinus]
MSNDSDNYCHVWAVDDEKMEDDLLESRIFSIDVHASFTYSNQEDDEELDLQSYIECYESVTLRSIHEVQFDHMIRDPQSAIRDMLVSMHVPVEDSMIHKISACVHRMSNDDNYKSRKVLRMCVNIDVMVSQLPFSDDNLTMIPASKAAIEGLEKVLVENPINCTICLDNLCTGSEAKRMPCSHLFHDHCIVRWLQMSNFCPICRFEI